MKSLVQYIYENGKTFEESVYELIKPYITTLDNYSNVKEDYSKFVSNVIKPLESLVKSKSDNSGNVNVRVYNNVVYISWTGSSEKYKGKEICFTLTNSPANDASFVRVKIDMDIPDKGLFCKCSNELKEKMLKELHPASQELYA